MEWLLANVPGLRSLAEVGEAGFGTIDSWIIYQLTSGQAFVTDHTNASRTLLYGIDGFDWDDELLDLFGVPRVSLPRIQNSSEVVGTSDPRHFGTAVPIAGIAGDQRLRRRQPAVHHERL